MYICSIEAVINLIEGVYRRAACDLQSNDPVIKKDAAAFLQDLLPDFERQREIRQRWLTMRFNDVEFDSTTQNFYVSISARRISSRKRAKRGTGSKPNSENTCV